MTATGTLLEARPQLRPEVVLGPGLIRGATLVHNLKDARTGRFLQVGAREFFIVSRLDGRRTLAEIGDAYAERFGARLDEARWGQILGTLGGRHLLVGTAPDYVLDELAHTARQATRAERTLLKAHLPLVDPDRFLTRWRPRLAFLFSPWFVLPALAAVIAVEVLVVAEFGTMLDAAHRLRDSARAAAVAVVLYWLTLAVHEVAHGLTCKHFGGSVPDIGVLWRFPVLAPYCSATDVMLFGQRRHRVYVAVAGVFSTMVLLVPVAVLWLLVPADSAVAGVAALLLLLGSLAGVVNLLPVFQLDGYMMLNHALNMQQLRKESYRYLILRVLALTGRGPAVPYPVRLARIYAAYGLGSLLVGALAAAAALWWLAATLAPTLGTLGGWAAAAGTALLFGLAALVAARQRRRAAAVPGGTRVAAA